MLFKLCIFVVLLLATVNGDMDDCPVYNIDYTGHGIDVITNIMSWEECGYLCSITDGCNYWTWQNYAPHNCRLKDIRNIVNQDGAISGSKDCYN